MKYSEIERKLRKAGCRLVSHGTNHDWWFSPQTNRRFQLPRHKSEEAKSKTLKSISEQSGVKF
ncbi:MAG: type II toxin-antitoxin system HicA family toxin [Rikenella sp.]|nr:type II toxin-antitoxin system HicA family toxin [Rikenella sp.]